MKKTLAVISLALLATSSYANEFTQIQIEKSSINFVYQQIGVKMNGKFKNFNSSINFNTNDLSKSKANFDIDLSSIDTGSAEANQEVKSKTWFNLSGFPTAKFISTNIKSLGGNKYEVDGQLSIKGQQKNLTIPVTLTQKDKLANFEGAFTINRGDFKIGEGEWSKFDLVANEVQVKFNILAQAKQ